MAVFFQVLLKGPRFGFDAPLLCTGSGGRQASGQHVFVVAELVVLLLSTLTFPGAFPVLTAVVVVRGKWLRSGGAPAHTASMIMKDLGAESIESKALPCWCSFPNVSIFTVSLPQG